MKNSLLIMLAFLACHSCRGWFPPDVGVTGIQMKNNASYDIACYVADGLNSGFSYPDTLLSLKINSFCLTEEIKDSDWIYGLRVREGYDGLVQFTKKGILSVFVFNQEDVRTIGLEEVFFNNLYIVRYDLSAEDLRLMKGIIFFPPCESMINIHMFPAYEHFIIKSESDE